MFIILAIRIICLLIGYLFGCIQTAFIVGKITKNIDVREHGSGNAGMTNVTRVIGRRAGLFVFVMDVLKAMAAFLLCAFFLGGEGFTLWTGLYAGFGVLLGHNFPFFLGFRGGKGIASSLGLMLLIDWRAALAVYALGVVVVLIWRYISLASLLMLFLFPVVLFALGHVVETIAVTAVMTVMAFYLHRSNIQRLIGGTERKFGTS